MLGFLAELLAAEAIDANGRRFVMREEYESKRPPTAASAERLQIAFGSWRAACRAADGHLADGRRFLPGPTGPRGKQTGVRYTREDVLQAVRLCAKEIGRTPSSGDYHHWELERRARLRVHGERPRLPGYKTVCRLFRADGRRARTSIWTAVLKALAA